MADKTSFMGGAKDGKSKSTSSKKAGDGGGGPAAQKSSMDGSKRLEKMEKLDDIGGKESLRSGSVRRKIDLDEGDYIKVTAPKLFKELSMLNSSTASKDAELDADEMKLKKLRLELKNERERVKKTTFGMRLAIGVAVILAVILIVVAGVIISMATKQSSSDGGSKSADEAEKMTTTAIETTAAEITTTTTSTTTTTEEPIKVKTHYQSICQRLPQFVNRSRRSCLAGSPPTVDSCKSDGGKCWESSFDFVPYFTVQNALQFSTNTISHSKTSASPPLDDGEKQLCATCDGKLGTCNDGQCDSCGLIQSTIAHQGGEWADNCDEPNPCWVQKFPNRSAVYDGNFEARSVCDRDCSNDGLRNALIYVQHLRCKLGKDGTVTEHCQDLPLRVWKCKDCEINKTNAIEHICGGDGDHRSSYIADCFVGCYNTGSYYAVLDGTKCRLPGVQEAYCYRGYCLPMYKNFSAALPNEIIADLGECKKQRDADEAALNP